jgi:hypothetical protein
MLKKVRRGFLFLFAFSELAVAVRFQYVQRESQANMTIDAPAFTTVEFVIGLLADNFITEKANGVVCGVSNQGLLVGKFQFDS